MSGMSHTRRAGGLLAVSLLIGFAGAACSKPVQEEKGAAAGTASESPLPTGPRLFVTDEVGGALQVIDIDSARSIATIPIGKRPRGLVLSPDASTIYVTVSGTAISGPGVPDNEKKTPADKKADGIAVVSVKDLRLMRVIHGGSDPENVAVSKDGTRLFATNEDTGQASALDPSDGKVLGTVKVGDEPEGVNMRPDGAVVYVTSEEDNKVTVIDTKTLKAVATIEVGPRPRSTAFLPDSSRAYVPAENGSSISVIDAKKHRLLQTIKLAGEMVKPMGTRVSPDGTRLFVTTGRGKNLVIIDTKTNQEIGRVEVGERPWGLAVAPDGKTVFTANGPSHDVSFVDVATRTVKTRVKAGDRPWGIVYVP
jgi:YVTN family beta-propeller protein